MREAKDDILRDAIKTSIKLNYKIIIMKRVIIGLVGVIALLIVGYFI